VQPAIDVVQIIVGRPLQHAALATIPAHAFAGTEVQAYHRDVVAVEAPPPGDGFTRRKLQL
jgi:hypothetical protein